MIKRKDIIFMVHNNEKQLVGFSYDVAGKNGREDIRCFRADWERGDDSRTWNMRVILRGTHNADSQVYNFCYEMARDGLPVELIAATGLKYFQMYLKEEIQQKSNFDFVLGDLLKGM